MQVQTEYQKTQKIGFFNYLEFSNPIWKDNFS